MRYCDQSAISLKSLGDVNRRYLSDEAELLSDLAAIADPGTVSRERIQITAGDLVRAVRADAANDGGLDAFMQQFDLSSQEGVLLMCIAEALLRIPDSRTADRLIADKVTSASWKDHLGTSDSLFVNASTWGLMLTGEMLGLDSATVKNPGRFLGKMAGRAGEPVVRAAMRQAMRIIGHQFVMGRTIEEALRRAENKSNQRFMHSFDMLGEAALTAADAARYLDAYAEAIQCIGTAAGGGNVVDVPSISIKLSALHPRYDTQNYRRVMSELVPRVADLTKLARDSGIALTIDAEETYRLELSLNVFEAVYRDISLDGYEGLGLAIQAYQRRAIDVVKFVTGLANDLGRRIPVRLVKGAYWDTEVKEAQEAGLASYPVFTRKPHTDVSYLACARRLLDAGDSVYAQFATHNAHTLASVLHFAGAREDFEFQRLHGMGEELYDSVVDPHKYGRRCRIYAPVGSHKDLLPYLVRRLLENGANSSFVNRILDDAVPVDDIIADPIDVSRAHDFAAHPRIPAPSAMFGSARVNSNGINLIDRGVLVSLLVDLDRAAEQEWTATSLVAGVATGGDQRPSVNPASTDEAVGHSVSADHQTVERAVAAGVLAQPAWDAVAVEQRADVLDRAAELMEAAGAEFIDLCVREAGKTVPDAIAELREAVDFLRYYASEARREFSTPRELPGPTGERNTLGLRGRGVFVCISPWNFPLAIFTGQIAAALAAGNSVVAKPAEQTPLVAWRAASLLHEAGVPADVFQLLLGDGSIGAHAVDQAAIAGVAFTGSTTTAQSINRSLAGRVGPIPAFIAETGGINAMFVDSSALPEQVVQDVVMSAFNSAGQRCSALRLLCLQEDIADRVIDLLRGAMQELRVGDPRDQSTDIGPVIDTDALRRLESYTSQLDDNGRLIGRVKLPNETSAGTFFAPIAYEIDSVDQLTEEVFGPVLHVVRYKAREIDDVLNAVNATGFGLTMGLHSRITNRAQAFARKSRAGNIYINRNMVGAVVGVQPFGGRGLSGTGPKAGGPNYLLRFATEYTVSDNVAAVGGNASLLSLGDGSKEAKT